MPVNDDLERRGRRSGRSRRRSPPGVYGGRGDVERALGGSAGPGSDALPNTNVRRSDGRARRDRDVGEAVGRQRPVCRRVVHGGRQPTATRRPADGLGRRRGVAAGRRGGRRRRRLAAADGLGLAVPELHAAAASATRRGCVASDEGARRRVAWVMRSSGDSGRSGRRRRRGRAPAHPGSCPAAPRPTPL